MTLPRKFYVHQRKGWEVGNFINCTPTIQTLSSVTKEPVPVLFDTEHVAEMYERCPFIRRVDEPEGGCLFTSAMTNMGMPDWEYIHRTVLSLCGLSASMNDNMPHTYVDECPRWGYLPDRYIAICRGMIDGSSWAEHKQVGDEIYDYVFDRTGLPLVFLGNTADWQRDLRRMRENHVDVNRVWCIVNSMRRVLGALRGADAVISNDTGLYHAAGALRRPGFIIWKTTPWEKNETPCRDLFRSRQGHWYTDFDRWLESYEAASGRKL